jgi:hypothetical protein
MNSIIVLNYSNIYALLRFLYITWIDFVLIEHQNIGVCWLCMCECGKGDRGTVETIAFI